MKKIFILSAPVNSGKTTRMIEWAGKQKSCDGILQPLKNGKRYLAHLGTEETRKLESDTSAEDDKVTIGNFIFSENTFEWARQKLLESAALNPEYLIIDEVGWLELTGKGLEPALQQLLSGEEIYDGILILVVRDFLLEDIIEKYNLKNRFEFFNFDSGKID